MFDRQEDVVERIIRDLRQPIRIDPALDGRVMRQIAAARGPSALAAAWRWLSRPRPVPLSPLAGLALAGAVVILAVLGVRRRVPTPARAAPHEFQLDRKSTRLNSSHLVISYAVFCLKKKKMTVIS